MKTPIVALTALALLARPAAAQSHAHASHGASPATNDSAFAALQARGLIAMGVDQYTSKHRFDSLPNGGRIELQRLADDSTGAATIRAHLMAIAAAFRDGDFSTPAFVHFREVPGAAIMAERRSAISLVYRELPRGAELRITSRDPDAVRAIHAFMAFQRGDHRTD